MALSSAADSSLPGRERGGGRDGTGHGGCLNAIRTTTHRRMNTARFELRYRSLSAHRCGYAFPCDEHGQVDLDQLSDEARENYLYARAMVGRDLEHPEVLSVH